MPVPNHPNRLPAGLPPGPVVIGAVAVMHIVGGGMIVRWWIRRQNPALFRDYD